MRDIGEEKTVEELYGPYEDTGKIYSGLWSGDTEELGNSGVTASKVPRRTVQAT